ncbi:MerR family transcriptional regulator [Streptomyces sp. MS2A]|nr:MerR family transcriptional regulator [Streptomyces sp. MS2A]
MEKPQERIFTTAQIGRMVSYSTQQVRDLERLGVIPPAARGPNGYRRYRPEHLLALRAYRALAAAIGPVPARRLLPVLRTSPLDAAAEMLDDLHAGIAEERRRVREALRSLDAILRDDDASFDDRDAMGIGELAEALGVRTSALRHWEDQGLVRPERAERTRVRRFGADAIHSARIVAALRAGGYPIPPIGQVLEDLRSHGRGLPARALLEQRLTDLSRRSVALLAAAGDLHRLLDR